jgi:3-oxoadipate enol-lactonase
MWGPLLAELDFPAEPHELRGFGDTPMPAADFSHADDLEAKLPAALTGASFGGLVCLEAAARWPELVRELVVIGAPLPDHDWSRELVDYGAEEERLIEAGDLEGAIALNIDVWAPCAAPEVKQLIATMQRRAFELQLPADAEAIEPESIDLAAIQARTLVVWGDRDHTDFAEIGQRLGREIGGAKTAVIQGAGHLPALERPAATAALLNGFFQA